MNITLRGSLATNGTNRKELTYEYIRGIITGEGCFSFCTTGKPDGRGIKKRVPAFMLSFSKQDEYLLMQIKNKLQLRNKIQEIFPRRMAGKYNSQPMRMLIVRDIGQLKNIIVPLCYKTLIGHKAIQFEEWLKNIETDPRVLSGHKIIPKLCGSGFYDKNQKFLD